MVLFRTATLILTYKSRSNRLDSITFNHVSTMSIVSHQHFLLSPLSQIPITMFNVGKRNIRVEVLYLKNFLYSKNCFYIFFYIA